MDIQEKKAFEIAFENKLGAHCCQFDLDEDGNYEDRETLCGWHMWLEAKAQAVPGWISVEDSLPEFGVPVLAKNMKFQEGKFWWIFERCDSDDGWVWSRFESSLNEAYCDDYEITHWMPLPAVLKVPEQK